MPREFVFKPGGIKLDFEPAKEKVEEVDFSVEEKKIEKEGDRGGYVIIVKKGNENIREIAKKALGFIGAVVDEQNIVNILMGATIRSRKEMYYKGWVKYENDDPLTGRIASIILERKQREPQKNAMEKVKKTKENKN